MSNAYRLSHLWPTAIPGILKVKASCWKLCMFSTAGANRSATMLFNWVVQTLKLFQAALSIIQFVSAAPTFFFPSHTASVVLSSFLKCSSTHQAYLPLMLGFTKNATGSESVTPTSQKHHTYCFVPFCLWHCCCSSSHHLWLWGILLPLVTTLRPQTPVMTQLILLSELI